jgi:hypothetical protein
MTQAQRTQTGTNSLVPAAVAGLVMAAALAGAILVNGLPTMSLAPGTVTTNPSLVTAEAAWMQQRIAQSAAFDVMSSANRASADQWEAMQDLLAAKAATGRIYTEAERQAILRHQLMLPAGASEPSALDAARKVQIERQVQSGVVTREFVGQRKGAPIDSWGDGDVRTPTHPQLR